MDDAERTTDRGNDSDDASVIAALVTDFFGAFQSGPGTEARMAGLRAMFLPGARIIRTCGLELTTYDVESFIAPRVELLSGGALTDFAEWPVRGRLEIFGDIAHWFGRYAKDGALNGEPCPGAGMKSMQFVRTPAGWRISAAAWDDERAGVGPDSYRGIAHPAPGSNPVGRTAFPGPAADAR